LQNSVGEEQADSLRLLIVVGGHGAFVPAFGNPQRSSSLTSIVNLRSPRRWRSRSARIRSADVAMVSPSIEEWCTQNRSQGVNGPGRMKTLRGITAPGILRLVVTLKAKKC
jgi:hypothetical protein